MSPGQSLDMGSFDRWPKVSLAILGLYFLFGLGLLAPLASNQILPSAPDHANHTAIIVQARKAIEEGQFPLRVAPWQHEGLRYPLSSITRARPIGSPASCISS